MHVCLCVFVRGGADYVTMPLGLGADMHLGMGEELVPRLAQIILGKDFSDLDPDAGGVLLGSGALGGPAAGPAAAAVATGSDRGGSSVAGSVASGTSSPAPPRDPVTRDFSVRGGDVAALRTPTPESGVAFSRQNSTETSTAPRAALKSLVAGGAAASSSAGEEEEEDGEGQMSEAAMATAMAVVEFASVVEGAGLEQLKQLGKVSVCVCVCMCVYVCVCEKVCT